MKYKLIAVSQKGDGMLPMKQSKELEAKKSNKQKKQELCNFIKNAFVVDGDVSFVRLEKPIEMRDVFVVEDSKRGNFIIGIRN
jgi:hypothetical protein